MYKKLLLAVVSIVAIQTVKAQTQKGSQMLGASFGISTTSSDTKTLNPADNSYGPTVHSKQTSHNFALGYSYFVADNLDIGIFIGYGQSKQEYTNASYLPASQKSHGFNSSLYLRKYFLYDNKIGIRTGPYFTYANSKVTSSDSFLTGYEHFSTNIYNGGIGLDFVYFPVKKLGLAATMGNISYTHQTMGGYSKGTSNSFGLNFGNELALSVNYVFGK